MSLQRLTRALAVLGLAAALACGGAADGSGSGAEWSGTVTTEGNVTTVVNESGSVWGGNVQLVEEASIGVDAGEDVYMLGSVAGVWATADEIYVVDRQVPALRVYDMGGRHLRDIGAEGSGPGEFRRPDSLAIGPEGRIYVRDYDNDRIMVFSPDGREAGTLPLAGNFRTSTGIVMTVDGVLYSYQRIPSDDPEERTYGMVPRLLDGDAPGEPIPRPELEAPQGSSLSARSESMSIGMGVPFAPGLQWVVAPSGAVISGVSDEYSFEIRYPDGSVTRVVRMDDPVPVDSAEADWHRKRITAQMRGYVQDWTWNGDDIPEHKPAYTRFLPDHSGRIWIPRPGPGTHVEGECDENPQPGQERGASCWGESTIWEVFDEEGRFLGGAEVPDTLNAYSPTYIRDDLFLAALTDEMGTPMVKRYRLVLPGGQ